MPFTTKFTWSGEPHNDEQSKQINDKLTSLGAKFLGVEIPDGTHPICSFADQESANEYADFMKQFNPETVEVTEVPAAQ